MPKWSDYGIILKLKKQGEKGAILTIFTSEHGRYLGWYYMSLRKKNYVQPGDLVDLRWNARLSEQLGVFNFETGKSTVGKIIEDNFRLSILSSFCSLIDALLPEREKCKNFFQMCDQFINNLTAEKYSSQDIVKKYLTWEIAFNARLCHIYCLIILLILP